MWHAFDWCHWTNAKSNIIIVTTYMYMLFHVVIIVLILKNTHFWKFQCKVWVKAILEYIIFIDMLNTIYMKIWKLPGYRWNCSPSSHQIATLNPFLCLCGICDIQNRSYFNITSSIQQLFSIKIMKNTNLVCIEIKICTY